MASLLEPDYAPHYEAWKASPTPENASALLDATKPVLESAVRSYGGVNPSPTLRTRARLLALDAFNRYDPNRAKLRTHLLVHLQGLRRHAAREGQVISIPERVGLDLHRLHTAEDELRDRFSRDPSDAELSEHTGLSMARLAHIRQSKPGYAEGSLRAEDTGEIYAPAVMETGTDRHLLEFLYHDLDPSDQVILEHTLGVNRKPILAKQEIARKLGISAGAVSQRAARIQSRLNAIRDTWPIGG